VAPLPSKTQCTAGFSAGGLRVPGFPALVHSSRDASRAATIGGRPFRACLA
jgi:hypothetical protein